MKKFVLLIMTLLICFLVGCTKNISLEQSQKNFIVYGDSIKEIAEKYNCEITEFNREKVLKTYVNISDEEKIEIAISNSSENSEKGVESFYMKYEKANLTLNTSFNRELFVDLANAISGKSISIDLLDDFLDAPESKYAAEDYGFQKINGEIIRKYYPLNFFEDWTLFYTLYEDNQEILEFRGLTKQLK